MAAPAIADAAAVLALKDGVVMLGAAMAFVLLFRRLGLGAVLGYLVAGALVGPSGLRLVNAPEEMLHIADFGIVLLLFLVAHRDQIYLGSDFDFAKDRAAYAFEAGAGNEFVYGAGAILHADALGEHGWGRRYATVLLVRPIPRFLWPSKYDDAAAMLGTPSIEVNPGTNDEELVIGVWMMEPGEDAVVGRRLNEVLSAKA